MAIKYHNTKQNLSTCHTRNQAFRTQPERCNLLLMVGALQSKTLRYNVHIQII